MDPKNPTMGQLVFDGSEFASYAVDMPPGACKGMQVTRPGFFNVCKEINDNQTECGGDAGITDKEVEDLAQTNERIARIDAFLPALAKAAEILTETRYVLDDKRQRMVMDAAKAVDRRAKNAPELLAKYEKTREYRSVAAKKAVKTRQQNAERQGDDPKSAATAPAQG